MLSSLQFALLLPGLRCLTAAAELAEFSCDHVRSDTGFADHRVLHIPTTMWDSAVDADQHWLQQLCCVYTWPVRDSDAATPYMTTFDGSTRTYDDPSTLAEVAEAAYAAVCAMPMGSQDCQSMATRCPLAPAPSPRAFGGSGEWTPEAPEEGTDSCNSTIQEHLRFGCTDMMDTARHICCHNTVFAEPRWYYQDAGGPGGLFAQLDPSGMTTFYDSACGVPLYRAPIGRSSENWQAESLEHGWPSFRREEAFQENMVYHPGGEIESVCGTHLGHNLPDDHGDRYCIDLVCIAGSPPTGAQAVSELPATGGSGSMAGPVAIVLAAVGAATFVRLGRRPGADLLEPLASSA